MGQRLDLQALLEDLLSSSNVYFQPPSDFMVSYPCIVYSLKDIRASHGDNRPYKLQDEYTITVIDPDPDSIIRDAVALLPQASFDRHFRTEGLNHYIFNLLF